MSTAARTRARFYNFYNGCPWGDPAYANADA